MEGTGVDESDAASGVDEGDVGEIFVEGYGVGYRLDCIECCKGVVLGFVGCGDAGP